MQNPVQIDYKALEAIFQADYRKPLGELSGTVKLPQTTK